MKIDCPYYGGHHQIVSEKHYSSQQLFWCDRMWPYQSKVWIKPVLFQGLIHQKGRLRNVSSWNLLLIFEDSNKCALTNLGRKIGLTLHLNFKMCLCTFQYLSVLFYCLIYYIIILYYYIILFYYLAFSYNLNSFLCPIAGRLCYYNNPLCLFLFLVHVLFHEIFWL